MASSSSSATPPTPSPGTSSRSPTAISSPAAAREIVVVGGGCYGTFYAGQLEVARRRGALEVERVLVVDRDARCQLTRDLEPSPIRQLVIADWDEFFDTYLTDPLTRRPSDPPLYIVPSPLMPHLMFEW